MRWQDCWKRTSTDPQHFHPAFLKRLWRFDSGRIRLRWSDERQGWFVERKVMHAVERIPNLQQWKVRIVGGVRQFVESDSWIQACDGYITIDVLPPGASIEQRLIENLQYFDLARWGGSANFIKALDEMTAQRDRMDRTRRLDRYRAIAEDVYDSVKLDLGEAAFVPTPKDGGNEWLNKDDDSAFVASVEKEMTHTTSYADRAY